MIASENPALRRGIAAGGGSSVNSGSGAARSAETCGRASHPPVLRPATRRTTGRWSGAPPLAIAAAHAAGLPLIPEVVEVHDSRERTDAR